MRVQVAVFGGNAASFDEVAVSGPTSRKAFYKRAGKRLLDVALVLVAAPIWMPVVAILAFGVMIDGGRPFYSQWRLGRHNARFRMWKLRTMVTDADVRLSGYLDENPDARAEWDVNQKLSDDPRITRFGRFLRRTSLDELPQLWNVLVGHMSLVGPRPMMCDQRGLYRGHAYSFLRPGITGPWQVSDRNTVSFSSRSAFDDRYLSELSLGRDIALLFQTVRTVMRCTGL